MTAVLFAGLLVRLAAAWYFYGTFDLGSWVNLSDAWQTGASPYDAGQRYSYSPVWFWVLSGVFRLNAFFGLPAYFVVKLPLILADVAVFFLLLKLARPLTDKPSGRLWIAATFFLNPVSILNTSYHGQFDNLAYAFILAACCLERVRPAASWLSFSFSAAVKHSTLLLAPVFAFRQKNAAKTWFFFAAAPALFLAATGVYLLGRDPFVFQNVFADTARLRLVPGAWGWSMAARYAMNFLTGIDIQSDPRYAFLYHLNYFLYPALFVVAYSLAKSARDLAGSILVYLLFFYTFTVQMAPQYTVWVLPFAALGRSRFFYLYSAVTTVHLAAFYVWESRVADTGGLIICFRLLAWLVTAFWLAHELKKAPKFSDFNSSLSS